MDLIVLLDFIDTTPFDCLILPNPSIRKLLSIMEWLQGHLSCPSVNIGAEISKDLIQISLKQRGRVAQDLFEASVQVNNQKPLLCFGIDILFEPSLQIDPLLVFRRVSLQRKVIVLWPGSFNEQVLSYAIPEHNHYHTYRSTVEWHSFPLLKIYPL